MSIPARAPLVISATRGNHGQSVALAAARHGIAATIVVPHGKSIEKNAAMRALGVELVEQVEVAVFCLAYPEIDVVGCRSGQRDIVLQRGDVAHRILGDFGQRFFGDGLDRIVGASPDAFPAAAQLAALGK